MKNLSKLLIIILFMGLTPLTMSAFAYQDCQRAPQCTPKPPCQRPSLPLTPGYATYNDPTDIQFNHPCISFCLDKSHSLKECSQACSSY